MVKSLGLLLVLLVACTRHLPMPMTAAQLAEQKSGRALTAYLGQRDASPAVCDLGASGPHVAHADVHDAMMDGLLEGGISPALWHDCMGRLIRSTDRETATSLLDAVARSYEKTLADRYVEDSAIVRGQVNAMHALLLDRPGGVAPHAEVMAKLLADLRSGIASQELGPVGRRYGTELIADVELEQGLRGGQLIDATTLDDLFQRGDEATLRHYAVRLPDAQLRTQAQRRVIRLHIQASPYPQVRGNAVAIEETLIAVGSNPIVISEHRPLRARIDTGALAARGVRVRQDLRRQRSTLLGYADDGRGISVFPQFSLHGALQIELEGIDGPLTVCAPPEALDPSPCVSASDVKADSRLARFDPDGTLRFMDRLTAGEAASLAASARRLVVPLTVGGQQLAALDWDLQFETPTDLVLDGERSGGSGPDLHVRVDRLETGRLTYVVSRGEEQYRAVVEREQANSFHVISRGADGNKGSDGSSGRDGLAGSSGNSATCPSFDGTNGTRGEDGGRGEDGRSGDAGGSGGKIVVEVASHGAESDGLLALLKSTMVSTGGSGGAGGSGGSGGRGGVGGSGGSGTTCTDSEGRTTVLSSGSSGLNGTDGFSGSSGVSGSNGRGGPVTVRLVE